MCVWMAFASTQNIITTPKTCCSCILLVIPVSFPYRPTYSLFICKVKLRDCFIDAGFFGFRRPSRTHCFEDCSASTLCEILGTPSFHPETNQQHLYQVGMKVYVVCLTFCSSRFNIRVNLEQWFCFSFSFHTDTKADL
jgi:hypothetical protein